jgi:4-oxalocrotonate tautomerase
MDDRSWRAWQKVAITAGLHRKRVGLFTEAQKREIVHKLTDAMVSIEGENMRPVTLVIIEEVKSGDWGIGGKSLTTADVKTLAAGKPTG